MKRLILALVILSTCFTGYLHAEETWVGAVRQGTATTTDPTFVPNVAFEDWIATGIGNATGLGPIAVNTPPKAGPGKVFTVRFQSHLGAINSPETKIIPFPGLNTSFEYTIIASLPCEIVSSEPVDSIRTRYYFKTGLDAQGNPGRFFILNSTTNRNISGSGFDDGEIVAGFSIPAGQVSSFVFTSTTGKINGALNVSGTILQGYSPNPLFLTPSDWIQSFRFTSTFNSPPLTTPFSFYFTTGSLFPTYTPVTGDLNLQMDSFSSFGSRCTGSMGDFVWNDQNGNGIQDAGEPGIDGVKVTLKTASGVPIAVQTTGVNQNQHGFYQFKGLCAGNYTVEVDTATVPSGYTPSRIFETPDQSLDSNGSPAAVTLSTDNSSDQTIDFGFVPPGTCSGSIGDFVWHDLNHDGIQNAGEPGIDNIKLMLYDNISGIKLAEAITAPYSGFDHGHYQFTNLCAGNYRVVVNPPAGYTSTISLQGGDSTVDSNGSPALVTLASNTSTDSSIDFGFETPCTGAIGNFIWHDLDRDGMQNGEPGINGVTVRLYKVNGVKKELLATTFTNPTGLYYFEGVCAGAYEIAVDETTIPPGYTPTTSPSATDPLLDSNPNPSAVTLPDDNSSDLSIDFGYLSPCTGTIGDFVWEDLNGNGIQDSGEPGIDKVIVTLRNKISNSIIKTTTTDVTGLYLFTGVCAGDYKIEVFPPMGYFTTTPNAQGSTVLNDSNPNPSSVFFDTDANSDISIDFGLYRPATIGDYVWDDLNGDGKQDSGEPGVTGAIVKLYACGGTSLIATTSTDLSGKYLFENLIPGNYQIKFYTPVGYVFTKQFADNYSIDSDANQSTGLTDCITMISGQLPELTIDAGLYQNATIGDKVWNDLNGNGIQETGEPGLSGVTVTLFKCNSTLAVATTTTDANGIYSFSVAPGSYYVVFTSPSGYTFTAKGANPLAGDDSNADMTGKTDCVTVASGETNNTIDAGLYQNATIGDKVWNDLNNNGIQDSGEPGISGVTVKLYNCATNALVDTTITDANGIYSFSVAPGSYYVVFTSPSGYTFTAKGANPLAGDDSNADMTGKTDCVTVASGETNNTIDAGLYQNATIGDKVWNDLNGNGIQETGEPGLSGVTVTLFKCNSTLAVATTTTDANGNYSFSVAPGSYYVVFTSPSGYTFTAKNAAGSTTVNDSNADMAGKTDCITVASGETNNTIDAGLYQNATIGDKVWNDLNGNGIQETGEPGLSGVTVTLFKCNSTVAVATTTTDANGFYSFSVAPGSYYVVFTSPSGYTFTAKNAAGSTTVNDSNADMTGKTDCITVASGETNNTIDAGLYQKAKLGNFVWEDKNNNGIQDTGEPGIPNVTVELYNCGGTKVATTTTDLTGYYLFDNLMPGSYSVKFITPNGYTIVLKNQGGDDAKDSDADPANGMTDCYTLASGQYNDTIDAGMTKECIPCKYGVKEMTLKLDWRTSTGDRNERIRVRANSLTGAVLYDSGNNGDSDPGLPVGATFTFAVPLDAKQIVVTVQGINHTTETLKATFSAECDLIMGTVDGNTYIKFKVMSAKFDGEQSCASSTCTFTIGYWKNHAGFGPQADVVSPLLSQYLGNANGTKTIKVTTAKIAYDILNQNVYGTATNGITKLYAQLLAAKLSIKAGADSTSVTGVILAADNFLASYGYADWGTLSSSNKSNVTAWHTALDSYNNGFTGPGHCGGETEVPCIDIKKKISVDNGTTWFDGDTEATAPAKTSSCTVKYKLEVNNCGTINLTNIDIDDPKLGISNYLIPSLAAGATKTLTSTEIPKLTATNQCTTSGSFENVATATAIFNNVTVTASDSAWLKCNNTTTCVDITKDISIDGGLTWKPADTQATAPTTTKPFVDYRLTVKNCGTSTLSTVVINDPELSLTNYSVGTLAAGASKIYTTKQISQLYDGDACTVSGSFSNTATVSGVFNGKTVTDSDTAWRTCTGTTSGGCSYTQGYWKTHSTYDGPKKRNNTWDKLGAGAENTMFFNTGQTWYEVLMSNPAGGNEFYILAHQYIAAYLNKLSGADTSAIDTQLKHAAELLDKYDGYPKKMSDITGNASSDFVNTASTLDQYNNGYIGPGHCK